MSIPKRLLTVFARLFLWFIVGACVMAAGVSAFASTIQTAAPTETMTWAVILWPALGVAIVGVAYALWFIDRQLKRCGLPHATCDTQTAGVRPTRPWPRGSASLPPPTRPAPPMPRTKLWPFGKTEQRPIRTADLPGPNVLNTEACSRVVNAMAANHKDDLGVFFFSNVMREHMRMCRLQKGRDGWWDESVISIEDLIIGLKIVMRKGDVVEIANFCMMLHQRGCTQLKD